MSLRIEPATDLEIIQQLAYEIWPIVYQEIISKEQIQYMLELMYRLDALKEKATNGHQFILAINEHQPVAFASFELNHSEIGKTKLHKLYVLPQFQKQKIGEQLLDYISEIARINKQHEILLNVNKYNSAQFFYAKLGFKVIGQEVIDIGNGFVMDDYIMQKKMKYGVFEKI
jgi:diamine N-acetyltransferase